MTLLLSVPLLGVSLALADDPDVSLSLDPSHAISASNLVLREGPMVVYFDTGWLVPIARGETRLGYAFSGTGTLEASFSDSGDALAFANRRALEAGVAVDTLRALAHQQAPYHTAITQGVILAHADWNEALSTRPTEAAAGFPATALLKRARLLDGVREIDDAAVRPSRTWMFADFYGADRLGYNRTRAADDRWLALYRYDEAATPLDDLVLVAEDADGHPHVYNVALAPWPEQPVGSAPQRDGVVPLGVDATILASAISGGLQASIAVDATFQFKAVTALETLHIQVPKREARGRTWRVVSLELDGVALPVPEGLDRGMALRLPAPLAEGAEARLRVVTEDTWSLQATGGRGQASKTLTPLPMVAHQNIWPHHVRVGVPEGDPLVPVMTGLTERAWTEEGRRWEASSTDTTPAPFKLSVGAWVLAQSPSVDGMPAVRVHMFKDEAETLPTFAPFVRTIVSYYEQLLPPFPTREIEIYQSVDDWFRFTWVANQGLVLLQQMVGDSSARADQPHLEEATLAHEIAHQWWGAQVDNARTEDQWMNETFAQVYACLFVGAAFGPDTCAVRVKSWRKAIERDFDAPYEASLRRAPAEARWRDIAYIYGPYVFGTMLRARLGDEAFFGALDAYLRQRQGRPGTAELLQAAFEATSRRPLGDFFDYWVEGGFIPSLKLTVSNTSAVLESDIPFGTIDVPIQVRFANGDLTTIWITVVDGRGTVTFARPPAAVELDPDGLVLARARKVVRVKG